MTESERLIRAGYDAWNRNDWKAMKELLSPDIEIDATDRVLNPDSYRGMDGFRRMTDEIAEVWDSWEVEPLQVVERGDVMYVAHRVRARGKGSGVEVEQMYWSVWTLRNGKVAKLALFVDRDRALAAAGLADVT
jgi:ketosteroid isomerase-like protein